MISNGVYRRRQVEYRLESWGVKPKRAQSTRGQAIAISSPQSVELDIISNHGPSPMDLSTPDGNHTETETDTSTPLAQPLDIIPGAVEKRPVSNSDDGNIQPLKRYRTSSKLPEKAWENKEGRQTNEGISISAVQLTSALEKIHVSCSEEQINELAQGRCSRAPFTPEELRVIEEAACFFNATQNESDAFALYFILWVLHADSPASSERRLNLSTLCASLASSPKDLELVQILISKEVRRVEALPNTEMEQFMLRTVLAVVYMQLDKIDAFKDERWNLTRHFYDLNTFLTTFQEWAYDPETRYQLDLSSYYILDFAFRFFVGTYEELHSVLISSQSSFQEGVLRAKFEHSQSIQLKILQENFLTQYPGTFGLQEGVLRNRTLRNCLDWCHKTLASQSRLPVQSGIIQLFLDAERARPIITYWLLWTQWQVQKAQPNGTFFWDAETERLMGMSGTALLWELIELAQKVFRCDDKQSRRSRIFGESDSEFIRRAYDRMDILSRMSDTELTESFLSHLISSRQPNADSEKSQELKLRRLFFSKWLHKNTDQDQVVAEGQANKLSTAIFIAVMKMQSAPTALTEIATNRRFSSFTSGGFDPTMLSSDTGSTLSDMRKGGRKFARQSFASSGSRDTKWAQMMAKIDEISDSMSVFRIATAIPENAAIDEVAALHS
jgi:hypothetical protein